MPQPVAYAFNGHHGLVIVYAVLSGPTDELQVRLAIDTAANITTISHEPLRAIGYQTETLSRGVQVSTANGIVSAARLRLSKFQCLGHGRESFPIIVHDISSTSRIDGVLGLDFLRGHTLHLDFSNGEIRLT